MKSSRGNKSVDLGSKCRVTFTEAEDGWNQPLERRLGTKRRHESRLLAASRKLQRLLFKPWDYDANLS